MPDYIERNRIRFRRITLREQYGNTPEYEERWVADKDDIEAIPPANVRPVVRAKWENPEDQVCWQCSRCKKYANQEYGLDRPLFWKICPHCGAVMEEGDVEMEDESTEETKPIIYGRWVAMYTETDLPSNPFLVCWECSNCAYVRASGWEGTRAGSKPECKFCENCGAQMKEVEE